jgi:PhoPQ-activated pathogenicity-related protein
MAKQLKYSDIVNARNVLTDAKQRLANLKIASLSKQIPQSRIMIATKKVELAQDKYDLLHKQWIDSRMVDAKEFLHRHGIKVS